MLRAVLPRGLWFQTEAFKAGEEAKLQKTLNSRVPSRLLPGKGLLGKHCQSRIRVWAVIRKYRESNTQTDGRSVSQMLIFDDNLVQMAFQRSLYGPIGFAPIFQLLYREEELQGGWYARVSTSVRMTLICAEYHDGAGFKLRKTATPKQLKDVVEENLQRKYHLAQGSKVLVDNSSIQPFTPEIFEDRVGLDPPMVSKHNLVQAASNLNSSHEDSETVSVVEFDKSSSSETQKQDVQHSAPSKASGAYGLFRLASSWLERMLLPIVKKQSIRTMNSHFPLSFVSIPTNIISHYATTHTALGRWSMVLKERNAALEKQVSALEEKSRALEDQNTVLRDLNAALRDCKISLEEEVVTHTSNIDALKGKLSGRNKFIDELQSQVQSLNAKTRNLTSQTENLTTQTRNSTIKNQKLIVQDQYLTGRVVRQSHEMAAMRRRIKKLMELEKVHTTVCQPVVLKMMTAKHMSYGNNRALAELDAKIEYTETFGLEVMEQEEGVLLR